MVSAEKMDFSTRNAVLLSETEPKPCDGDPATKERVPFKSEPEWLVLATTTGEPSGRMRRTGRFAVERSTQSQSPSSSPPRRGANWTASNSVFNVRFNKTLAPALTPIFSRRVGKNAGAEALTL